eukprot:16447717-Heterocapsa_arctica.AAC.1
MSRSQGIRSSVLWQGFAPGGHGCQMAESLAFSVVRRSEVWPDHLECWVNTLTGVHCCGSLDHSWARPAPPLVASST